MQSLQSVDGSDPSPPAPRKIKHCQPFIQVVFQPAHELRCNLFELLDDFTLELLGILSRRGIENIPHGLGDPGLVLFAASILLGVFTQVKLTTVPGHRRINCPPGRLQSFVIVTDQQLDPSQSTLVQIRQKPSPMHLRFTDPGAQTQHLPRPETIDSYGFQDRHVLHPATSSNLLVVGIQIHDRILSQLPASKLFQLFVQHPRHSRDLGG